MTNDVSDVALDDDIRTGIQVGTGVCIFAGLWLVASSTFLPVQLSESANNLLFGVIVALLSVVRYFWAPRQAWLSWVVCAAGAWVTISPFVLGFAGNWGLVANDVLAGIVVALFGLWAAVGARRAWVTPPPQQRQPQAT